MMMKCGHAANSRSNGKPSCVICAGITPDAYIVANAPNLEGRFAKCFCGKTEPSSTDLAFFEFRGEGSERAKKQCQNCSYYEIAHNYPPVAGQKNVAICHRFSPHGAFEFDDFYCGCRGWD